MPIQQVLKLKIWNKDETIDTAICCSVHSHFKNEFFVPYSLSCHRIQDSLVVGKVIVSLQHHQGFLGQLTQCLKCENKKLYISGMTVGIKVSKLIKTFQVNSKHKMVNC